tara:strand:+ start:2831 stop:3247 length:417 start_codon:yes stop_codon:yes gene_type:complete
MVMVALPMLVGCAISPQRAVNAAVPPAHALGLTTLEGVFSSAQAGEGERFFRGSCQGCHEIREFSGIRFTIRWSGQTVGELFEVISTTMPQGSPGSLAPDAYAAVVAFLLRLNGYPAGESTLRGDVGSLKTITIVDPE